MTISNTEPEARPEARHVPVLPNETMVLLAPRPGEIVVDCTAGAGGHTQLFAEAVGPAGRVIAIDQDPTMLAMAQARVAGENITWVHDNFENLGDILRRLNVAGADVVFADLGFCSDQLADVNRGLSFQAEGPLDMRLDPTRGATAADLLRRASERELADIFWQFGEERHSRRVARKIVEARQVTPLATTAQLAELVRQCVPRSKGLRVDPATRVFQALRIAVNDELGALDRFLENVFDWMNVGGRVGVVSFHSLEDRRVKQAFRNSQESVKQRTRKPVTASEAELRNNPRSRSAKLRVAERLRQP